MKTIKLKALLVGLCLGFILNPFIYSQNETKAKQLFVRVYNLDGEKTGKGYISIVNDTLLELQKNGKHIQFKVNDIGTIKTKRSGGNNVLIGSVVGATTGAIFGAATAEPDAWVWGYTSAEGALGFGVLGALGGAAIGGITVAFKESETFHIAGKLNNWSIFINRLDTR